MRRFPGTVVLLGSALSLVLATFGPIVTDAQAAELRALPAIPADSVVDAYGIGIHLPFLDTPYVETARVADALVDLGVRHVRDDLFLDNPGQYAAIRTVAERGIAFDLIMGRPDRPGRPADYVRTVADLPRGAVESVEGINEWDLFGAENPEWSAEAATWQRDLYTAVRGTPETASLPVLSPSMAFRWNYSSLPDLSPYSDKANAHMYPGGRKPTNEVSQITDELRTVVPSKPLVVTEAGYHNAVNTTNGHLPVSEAAAAAYLPRLLLDHLSRGHERVYSYELIDQFPDVSRTDPEANFGLLRHDWTPKPAYTAMRTLLGLLADPGPAFTPEPLSLAASGWPGDGRYLVTQKRDGSHVLLLWRDSELYDPERRTALPDPAAPVTLSFGRHLDMAVHRIAGDQPVREVGGNSVTVAVDGSVTAITLRPPGAAAVPGRVVIRSTAARRGAVRITWRPPAANGRPILGYRVSAADRVRRLGADARRVTIKGLPRRTSLRVAVRARNSAGWGPVVRTARVRTK